MDVLCEKCKKPMAKKGTLNMSNTQFQVYKCPACGADRKIALGVMR